MPTMKFEPTKFQLAMARAHQGDPQRYIVRFLLREAISMHDDTTFGAGRRSLALDLLRSIVRGLGHDGLDDDVLNLVKVDHA